MKRLAWYPIIISTSALALVIAMFSEAPFRPALAFWFLLICPGMAFVRLLHVKEFTTELTLAVALSIALNTIVSETMLLAKMWSPNAGLLVLIGLSMLGVVLQIIDPNETRVNARLKQL